MLIRIKNGQSTLEYALVISVVAGGLIAMSVYMGRGAQGQLKESTDRIGSQFDSEGYSKTWVTGTYGTDKTETKEQRNIEGVAGKGVLATTITKGEIIKSSETEKWGKEVAQEYTEGEETKIEAATYTKE